MRDNMTDDADYVEENTLWKSKTGIRFYITTIARHAQDCSNVMVVYKNIEATQDAPAGTTWGLDERICLKRMTKA